MKIFEDLMIILLKCEIKKKKWLHKKKKFKQDLSKNMNFGQVCRKKIECPPKLTKLIIRTNSSNKNIRI